ncbi:aldo/keto reductase [Nesterenkonia sp. MY13]|uniref:Aldo/keto reductase n=1 Tax=Nesterenkonia sedimenti TaxID=1463632 RepID=A0A7X8YCI0_9MICC|nr:aldo/keto reductase [Nesterenkonia sedimenti]NLS08588.1 aldo/keto reductase [Nesterenkonia sedimenti]
MTTIELNSGFHIPQIGFGTSKSRTPVESVPTALQIGYRHVDTAQMYGNEAEVGEGVRASGVAREEVFVTTKLHNPNHDPADVHRSFEQSLQALGFDYVDLFLIHWPLPFLEIDYVDTWKTMIELRDSGRAKSIGVSNFMPDHLDRLIEATGVTPAVNQIEVHPYFANDQLREYSKSLGLAVEAWSPLGKGDELGDPLIVELAQKYAVTPAQLILRWHIQRGDVVIPKSDHRQRAEQNFDVLGFELDESDMAAIGGLDKGEEGRRSPHPNEFGK